MSPEHEPANFQSDRLSLPEDPLSAIVSALRIVAVAVAALPGAELEIHSPVPEGSEASVKFKVSSEGDLNITFSPAVPVEENHSIATNQPVIQKGQISPLEAVEEEGGRDIASHPKKPQEAAFNVQNKTFQKADREKERRVLLGRLGAEPFFKQTANGTLIARLLLAVPNQVDPKGKPTWETVLAFGDKAKKLQSAGFTKGQSVEVVGYNHEQEVQGKGGKSKMVKEVYAVVVKPAGPPVKKP